MSDEKAETEKPVHPARNWWRTMTGWPSGNNADRGALANLRRCRKPIDALLVPATFNLMQRLPKSNKDRVAVLAVVLAHIRDDTSAKVANAIGREKLSEADSADLSESRLRRLLQTEGHEQLLTNMVRLVKFTQQKKNAVNVEDMAKTILYWDDGTRRRWAFDYYAVDSAAPKTNDNQDTDIEEART